MCLATYLDSLEGRSAAYIDKQRRVISSLLPAPQEALNKLALRATQSTVNDALNRIRCYGSWLSENGQENPYEGLSRPSADRAAVNKAVFTRAEVEQLINCEGISLRNRTLWATLAMTGLRPIEASRIKPEHIVRQGGRWVLALPASQQKAKRADKIVLPEKLANRIMVHLPLITGAPGKLYRKLRADMKTAGLNIKQGGVSRTPYNLRSFFITELLRNNANLEEVRIAARHSDIKTTLTHYARFQENEAAETRMKIFNFNLN